MHFRRTALFAAVAALALPIVVSAGPMKPGKWQTTVETKVSGMDMKMPAVTIDRCITTEEAENPQPPKGKNDACTVSDYKLDGNVVTWTINCPQQGMTGEGKMTLSGETYEGETHLKMQGMEMSQKLTGKRLGDCDATDKK